MMWGPVFYAELVATARGRRFYALRVLYGLLILYFVTTSYDDEVQRQVGNGTQISPLLLSVVGARVFATFVILQAATFIVMTPTLVAGAIADERQRKTLHYLLASRLTAPEIVLGKVAARLLRLGVLGGLGLPILCLVGLLGGIDFGATALVYGATASTTFFLAGLAILCSVYAKRPRDAMAQAYFYEFLWFTVPSLLLVSIPFWGSPWLAVGAYLQPVLQWVEASSPTVLLRRFVQMGSVGRLVSDTLWMIGLQCLAGIMFLAIAVWRLRPVFRAADDPSLWTRLRGVRARPRARWWFWARPTCGADGLLWKEMHVGGIGNARRAALFLGGLVVGGLAVYSSWDLIRGAFDETWHQGLWGNGMDQRALGDLIRGANGVLMSVVVVGMGATAAGSVTAEREADTWTSLAASPLEGVDVVRAKTLGVVWRFRGVAYALGACWALGLLVGAIHPVGVLLAILALLIDAGFVATLGVAVSLWSKRSSRALTTMIVILLALNVVSPILAGLLRQGGGDELNMIGCIPVVFTFTLITPGDFHLSPLSWWVGFVAVNLAILVPYAAAGTALSFASIRWYQRAADRPRRIDPPRAPARFDSTDSALTAGPVLDAPHP